MISLNNIQDIATTIAREFQPEKIILFGSYAWGTPGQDSDVDFFIIKNTTVPAKQRIEELDRLFPRRDFPMDFLVYTPTQVQHRRERGDFFIENILTKGTLLYDATTMNLMLNHY